jgi:hypothetical protein
MACPSHFILATFIMTAISSSLKDSIIENYLIGQTPSSSIRFQTFPKILLTEIHDKNRKMKQTIMSC